MLGIFTGLVLTVIIQSSSAMVGILQALSVTGVMTFELVYPMVMGINLGTCVTTALVCSIGSSKDAKRTGVVHIVFNTIGTVLFMVAMTILRSAGFMPDLWEGVVDSGIIANFQTVFNLVTAIVLLPFTGLLVKLACAVVKDDVKDEEGYPELAALDRKLMISPVLALGHVTDSVAAMAKAARDNVVLALEQFETYDEQRAEIINSREDQIDRFTDHVENYLIELSHSIDSERENHQLNVLMQCSPNIERIGDYATNFDEMAKKLSETDLTFSEMAKKEMALLSEAVVEILRLTVDALEKDSVSNARRIEPLEEVIDDMVLKVQNNHSARLRKGECSIESGLIYMDLLTNLERTADQCSNIALLVLGKNDATIMNNYHNYIRDLHISGDQTYLAEQRNRREQYLAPLEAILNK
jgi:phosphate:Na+ symporter